MKTGTPNCPTSELCLHLIKTSSEVISSETGPWLLEMNDSPSRENIFHYKIFLLCRALYLIITYCDPIRQPIHYTNVRILTPHWRKFHMVHHHWTAVGPGNIHYIICRSPAGCQNHQEQDFTNVCIEPQPPDTVRDDVERHYFIYLFINSMYCYWFMLNNKILFPK